MLKRIVVPATLALVIVGCGGAKSDRSQVTSVTHRYLVALADGNGDEACSLLTPEAQRQLLKSVGATGRLTCAREITLLHRVITPEEIAELRRARVSVASLSGNSAGAELMNKGRRSVFPLSKTSKGWLLDAASVAPSP
jgi:hypothetical protein